MSAAEITQSVGVHSNGVVVTVGNHKSVSVVESSKEGNNNDDNDDNNDDGSSSSVSVSVSVIVIVMIVHFEFFNERQKKFS